MPTIQSSFAQETLRLLPGQLMDAFGPRSITNKFGSDLLAAGRMAFKVPATAESAANKQKRGFPGQVYQQVTFGTVADVDAIGSIVSSTGTKTVGSGVTAGVAGSSLLQPARKITVTFDASTDWDPTNATLVYVNQLGVTTTETLAIATSTTATSTGYAKQFVSLAIPAQTGATGTATIGIAAVSSATLTIKDCAGVVVRQANKTMPANPTNLYNIPGLSTTATAHYSDGDSVPLLLVGDIVVETEEDVNSTDDVYVRIAAGAGGSNLGTFRNDADTATCVLVPGARFKHMAASGAAWVSFGTQP